MLRVGVIGAGGIAVAHLGPLAELASEVTVFSRSGAGEVAARFGARTAGSVDELIATVDVVLIATPTPTHLELTRVALEAGRHVVLEKPVALTEAEAEELEWIAASALASSGARVLPAHVVRYFPAYERLARVVEEGGLGELVSLRFSRGGAHPVRPWFGDAAASGGVLLDLMIHDLDAARWVAGEVVSVAAVRSRRRAGDGPPVEAAHAVLTHSSGAISEVSALWGPPDLAFATAFTATGSRAVLAHDSTTGSEGIDPYAAQLADLLGALEHGRAARVGLSDGIAAVRLAAAAGRSAAAGETVVIARAG